MTFVPSLRNRFRFQVASLRAEVAEHEIAQGRYLSIIEMATECRHQMVPAWTVEGVALQDHLDQIQAVRIVQRTQAT